MEVGRYQVIVAYQCITVGSNSYEKVKTFKYLGTLSNHNSLHEVIIYRSAGN
jgi:hypothetical protein